MHLRKRACLGSVIRDICSICYLLEISLEAVPVTAKSKEKRPLAVACLRRIVVGSAFHQMIGPSASGPPGGKRTGDGIGPKAMFVHDPQNVLAHFGANAGVVVEHA